MASRKTMAVPRGTLVGLVALRLGVLVALVPFFLGFALKVFLAFDRLPWIFALFVIAVTWRFAVLVSLLVVAVAMGVFFHRVAVPSERWARVLLGHRFAAAFVVALALLLVIGKLLGSNDEAPNRFGFYPTTSKTSVWHSANPALPSFRVVPNSLGYRDEEWQPGPVEGRRRVLMVGDSFLYGYWVPNEEDVL